MSMFRVFDTIGSAMSAQTLRLNTTASNMANVDSVSSSIDQTYRARHPVFAAVFDQSRLDDATVGVEVKGIVESQAPLRQVYNPDHPMADDNGNIFMPNVNVVEEMTNMMSASRSYQSSIEVANVAKQLAMRVLTMGQ